jgi:hypothetical protein
MVVVVAVKNGTLLRALSVLLRKEVPLAEEGTTTKSFRFVFA